MEEIKRIIQASTKTTISLETGLLKNDFGEAKRMLHAFFSFMTEMRVPPPRPSDVESAVAMHSEDLRQSRLSRSFRRNLDETQRLLVGQSKVMGSHKEGAVDANAPSRCPPSELTELQRAAVSLFEPGCPPQMRRMMVEMTPGSGKTNVYFEVISKFLGKRNPDTGDYFDIVILGDSEVFAAFESVSRSPAKVNIAKIHQFNEEVCKLTNKCTYTWSVLHRRNSGESCDPPGDGDMRLTRVNAPHASLSCKLSTCLVRSASSEKEHATCPRDDTGAYGTSGKGDALTKDPKYFCRNEEKKPVEDECVWRGTRVFLIPYALAGKWIVSSAGGLERDESERKLRLETLDRAEDNEGGFVDAPTIGFKGPQGLLGAKASAGNSRYQPGNFVINSSNTVFVIDEVQNIGMPSRWERIDARTDPYAPHLSEALWRQTGDLCNDGLALKNLEGLPRCERRGVATTPYIFSGTGTPNVGTNPESSVCLLQLLNGKQRAELFLPRWPNDPNQRPANGYAGLDKHRSLKDLRELLSQPGGMERTLYWPPVEERFARDLIVYPRKFLEEGSGFVRDVTKTSEPFSLVLPKMDAATKSIATSWTVDFTKFKTCQQATEKLVEWKLLPFEGGAGAPAPKAKAKAKAAPSAAAQRTSEGAYLHHEYKNGTQHDFAYRAFLCAARDADLEHQASRIYKPVYEGRDGHLNRLFLQDVVASRVFTANSYYDFRLYPQVLPSQMADEMKQPLTRLVAPVWLLGEAAAKESPRRKAAKIFGQAKVIDLEGKEATQDPWSVPADAARHFEETLRANLTRRDGPHADCRWGEWSLCADLQGLRPLCERLVAAYNESTSRVDVKLEDELRDFVARNCPKMVQAADDLYCAVPHPGTEEKEFDFMEAFAPGLASESKSFFFLNARTRPSLDNNLFVILASFYFRMRCRPFLQQYLRSTRRSNFVPRVFDDSKATVQHRLAWLDALLLRFPDTQDGQARLRTISEGLLSRLRSDIYTGAETEKPPSTDDWSALWGLFLEAHFSQRLSPMLVSLRAKKAEEEGKKAAPKAKGAPKTKAAPAPPRFKGLGAKGAVFFRKQREIHKGAMEARKELAGLQRITSATGGLLGDTKRMKQLQSQAEKTTLFLQEKKHLPARQQKVLEKALETQHVPAIFCIGDPNLGDLKTNKMKHVELASYYDNILQGKAAAVDFETLLLMMGSQGLRLAMNQFMKDREPCVRAPPSGQSMLFAGFNAHKALDFKCIGLNVSFGPQPRGQRIQEMGRNWRNCMGSSYINLRQIFLLGEPTGVLGGDLLLDSFYEAQSEVINWVRLITISAGLGCSIWWAYSQWTKALSSYHSFRRAQTAWFFDSERTSGQKTPCLDIAAFEKWTRKEAAPLQEHLGFHRCNRSNYHSRPMRLGDDSVDYGRIVRSAAGAFFPDEIVSESSGGADLSCRRGTAADEILGVKYCLSEASARKLDAQAQTQQAKAAPEAVSYAAVGGATPTPKPGPAVGGPTPAPKPGPAVGGATPAPKPGPAAGDSAARIASEMRQLISSAQSQPPQLPPPSKPQPPPAATEQDFATSLKQITKELDDVAKALRGLEA